MSRFRVLLLFLLARASLAGSLAIVSSPSYSAPVALGGLATAFGTDLATVTLPANSAAWPLTLGGRTVTVRDSAGSSLPAPVFFVSPGQISFQVPAGMAAGNATISVTSGDGAVSTGTVQIAAVAPGLFSADSTGQGAAAAVVVQNSASGGQTSAPAFVCNPACTPAPIDLASASATVLELYGTGIAGRSSLANVQCTAGGTPVQVQYAGQQGTYAGLDQVNVALPASLANQGVLAIALTVDGHTANTVTISTGPAVNTSATAFYVAPNGSDSFSGTLPSPNAAGTDGPFATLARAQQALRGIPRTSPLVVMLRAGAYTLSQPLTLTAADSGSPSAPVTWENYPGETAIVSGGRVITGWTPSPAIPGAWQASVAGFLPFEQLWVNGQRRYRVRAAVPYASGYFNNLGPVYVGAANGCTNSTYPNGYSPSLQNTTTGLYQCFDRFFFKTGDINPDWDGLADPNHPIQIVDFEDWTIARMRLASIGGSSQYADAPAGSSVAYLAGATVAGQFWGFLQGHRYLIENVAEALSSASPGEWYVATDASGKPAAITYVPSAGENFAAAPPVVVAPQISQLVVANDPALAWVTFRGITFSYANFAAGSPGYAASNGSEDTGKQAIPAALSFTNASHIVLDSVTISQTGGWGAEFVGTNSRFAPSGACTIQNPANCNNQVVNSVFTDLGSGAIRLGAEPANADTDSGVAQYNLIANTVLAGGDRVEPGIAITLGNTHHNTIDHNDVYDWYNQAINLGNSLNFNGNGFPNWTHDNQITYNHIYRLGQGITSDMGAVHAATGLALGNLIEYNNFHDIVHDPGAGGYGGWGIYFDQGSSFLTASFNLVYNTTATGFTYNHSEAGNYQLLGTPNLVTNNIFAFGSQASVHRNLDDGALNLTFTKNIVYWDMTQPMPAGGPPSPQIGAWTCSVANTDLAACFRFQQNLYYSAADPPMNAWRFLAAEKRSPSRSGRLSGKTLVRAFP